jgi:hypothetical protein
MRLKGGGRGQATGGYDGCKQLGRRHDADAIPLKKTTGNPPHRAARVRPAPALAHQHATATGLRTPHHPTHRVRARRHDPHPLQHSTTRCNIAQHVATHRNTLQHSTKTPCQVTCEPRAGFTIHIRRTSRSSARFSSCRSSASSSEKLRRDETLKAVEHGPTHAESGRRRRKKGVCAPGVCFAVGGLQASPTSAARNRTRAAARACGAYL